MFALSKVLVVVVTVLIICTVRQVELTPIVAGNEIETSDQNLANGSDTLNVKGDSALIAILQNQTNLVLNETLVDDDDHNRTATSVERSEAEKGKETEESNEKVDTVVVKNITTSLPIVIKNDTKSLDSNETMTMQVLVSSKPLLVSETNYSISTEQHETNGNVTVVSLPVNVGKNESSDDFDYKKKARPSFYPYMEQILRSESLNDTTVPSYPTIVKSEKYEAQQNVLMKTNGPENLPNFSEKEMNKRRLNHWKVKQIMKGVNMKNEQEKVLGQSGTKNGFPVIFGQKRAAYPPSYILANGDSKVVQDVNSSEETLGWGDSKLRTFFSWFSNPSKGKQGTTPDDILLQQAKAQQAVLPFALSYRGDYLFW
ncbi:unnamed protein product [Orchesella dallaii]|uniref:Uncharacterized protein n=1 Tax=Orchesella dallaii TaxID=48710 RepID=A0ABP1PSX2_9HEXA